MTEEKRSQYYLAVYLIFVRDNQQVLLAKRANTGFADGLFSLVAGHVDDGEFATAAAIREAKEEAGVEVDISAIKLVHIMHRASISERVYVDLYFMVTEWKNEISNTEPDKCETLSWFPLNSLPSDMLEYVKDALVMSFKGIMYSERGEFEKV